jgi:hypothetical protein
MSSALISGSPKMVSRSTKDNLRNIWKCLANYFLCLNRRGHLGEHEMVHAGGRKDWDMEQEWDDLIDAFAVLQDSSSDVFHFLIVLYDSVSFFFFSFSSLTFFIDILHPRTRTINTTHPPSLLSQPSSIFRPNSSSSYS